MFLTINRKNHSLPDEGWIHECIYCNNPTSETEIIYKNRICICTKCSKKYDKDMKNIYINICLDDGILKEIKMNKRK